MSIKLNDKEISDIQELSDKCCEDPKMMINYGYIGEVFQWIIDNDYLIVKKEK